MPTVLNNPITDAPKDELKEQAILLFEGGQLTFNRKGYGLHNNCGALRFRDEDLDYDMLTRVITLDSTDLKALRDFLIEYVR